MRLYIVGRISDHVIVESGIRSDFNNAEMRAAIAINYGGVAADYDIFTMNDSTAKARRFAKGDDWSAVWTGNTITDIDFTAEDNKKWLDVTASKNEIEADNTDGNLITINMLVPDKSGIDTSFTGRVNIMCRTPAGVNRIRFGFTNGVATKTIRTDKAGDWRIPANSDRMDLFRVVKAAKFESIEQ